MAKKNGSIWICEFGENSAFLPRLLILNMNPNDDLHHIDLLKAQLGKAVNKTMSCSSDFVFLQAYVFEHTHENLGLNTLKRLWNHGNLPVKPRQYTLDILSRTVGYRNFDDFRRFYDDKGDNSSDMVLGKNVQSNQLHIGDRVTLHWNPGRVCTVEYIGNNTYRVISSEKTKLQPGNTFQTPFFAEGTPMLLSNLIQDGTAFNLYEIGKQGGVTQVELSLGE